MNAQGLVSLVLGLQFAVFGWRINREIKLDDEGRRTWLLVSDYLNLASMLTVLAFCIIGPIASGKFSKLSTACVAVAFVLTIFYPIILAGHYRLFSRRGARSMRREGRMWRTLPTRREFCCWSRCWLQVWRHASWCAETAEGGRSFAKNRRVLGEEWRRSAG